MFQRSITSKMRVKWVLNPKALTTNFPHAAHPVGVLLLTYSISPLFTCIPYLSKLQVINVIAINRQSSRERNCLHVCLLRCPSLQLETRWCLNCPIYTSLWLIRQVLLAWTLPLYTDQHMSHTEQSSGLLACSIAIPVYSMCVVFFFNLWLEGHESANSHLYL